MPLAPRWLYLAAVELLAVANLATHFSVPALYVVTFVATLPFVVPMGIFFAVVAGSTMDAVGYTGGSNFVEGAVYFTAVTAAAVTNTLVIPRLRREFCTGRFPGRLLRRQEGA
ncbi:hypothetical protein ACWCPT_27710 [Streptomyces sp. NPDC002308]